MANMFRTSNPTLGDNTFRGQEVALGNTMTLTGTVNKTGILLLCAIATAAWSWNLGTRSPEASLGLILVGALGGLAAAFATIFKKDWSPVTAPIYALLEGLVLGSISVILESRYPGIAMEAVALTFGTLLALLLAYHAGIIKVTQRFQMGVVAATGGIALFYFLTFILGFFGFHFTTIFGSSPLGIAFSVLVVIVAALNLVLDFEFIVQGADQGAPKYMEWYGGFALLVTLVWLYLEILRLLAKMRDRR
jgi:uncharacterized YccA/Bax inhibitor family protein